MFKTGNLTDQEKLLFAESYIKELKLKLNQHQILSQRAVYNLHQFMEDVKKIGPKGHKIVSYKKEMMVAHEKNRRLSEAKNKVEKRNYVLRGKIRELKELNKER